MGNPTVDEVDTFLQENPVDAEGFRRASGLDNRPIIALLAGSRKQEIRDNLPRMIQAAQPFMTEYQLVLAAAPGISDDYYIRCLQGAEVKVLRNQTYNILRYATAALVTSGTATLEAALFRVPQVVCYYTPIGKIISFLKKRILSVRFISLVNLIADREVVKELVADQMKESIIRSELNAILYDTKNRQRMLADYDEIINLLGEPGASQHAAQKMVDLLKTTYHQNQ